MGVGVGVGVVVVGGHEGGRMVSREEAGRGGGGGFRKKCLGGQQRRGSRGACDLHGLLRVTRCGPGEEGHTHTHTHTRARAPGTAPGAARGAARRHGGAAGAAAAAAGPSCGSRQSSKRTHLLLRRVPRRAGALVRRRVQAALRSNHLLLEGRRCLPALVGVEEHLWWGGRGGEGRGGEGGGRTELASRDPHLTSTCPKPPASQPASHSQPPTVTSHPQPAT